MHMVYKFKGDYDQLKKYYDLIFNSMTNYHFKFDKIYLKKFYELLKNNDYFLKFIQLNSAPQITDENAINTYNTYIVFVKKLLTDIPDILKQFLNGEADVVKNQINEIMKDPIANGGIGGPTVDGNRGDDNDSDANGEGQTGGGSGKDSTIAQDLYNYNLKRTGGYNPLSELSRRINKHLSSEPINQTGGAVARENIESVLTNPTTLGEIASLASIETQKAYNTQYVYDMLNKATLLKQYIENTDLQIKNIINTVISKLNTFENSKSPAIARLIENIKSVSQNNTSNGQTPVNLVKQVGDLQKTIKTVVANSNKTSAQNASQTHKLFYTAYQENTGLIIDLIAKKTDAFIKLIDEINSIFDTIMAQTKYTASIAIEQMQPELQKFHALFLNVLKIARDLDQNIDFAHHNNFYEIVRQVGTNQKKPKTFVFIELLHNFINAILDMLVQYMKVSPSFVMKSNIGFFSKIQKNRDAGGAAVPAAGDGSDSGSDAGSDAGGHTTQPFNVNTNDVTN